MSAARDLIINMERHNFEEILGRDEEAHDRPLDDNGEEGSNAEILGRDEEAYDRPLDDNAEEGSNAELVDDGGSHAECIGSRASNTRADVPTMPPLVAGASPVRSRVPSRVPSRGHSRRASGGGALGGSSELVLLQLDTLRERLAAEAKTVSPSPH